MNKEAKQVVEKAHEIIPIVDRIVSREVRNYAKENAFMWGILFGLIVIMVASFVAGEWYMQKTRFSGLQRQIQTQEEDFTRLLQYTQYLEGKCGTD